jgi:hypothetical protein
MQSNWVAAVMESSHDEEQNASALAPGRILRAGLRPKRTLPGDSEACGYPPRLREPVFADNKGALTRFFPLHNERKRAAARRSPHENQSALM